MNDPFNLCFYREHCSLDLISVKFQGKWSGDHSYELGGYGEMQTGPRAVLVPVSKIVRT